MCRQWSLPRLCHKYVLALCEGAQSPNADKMGANADFDIRAIAEALRLVIVVGTGDHAQSYGTQHSRSAWSSCQLRLVAKPGHFGIAWV